MSRCNSDQQPKTWGCSGLDSAPAAASQPHNPADEPWENNYGTALPTFQSVRTYAAHSSKWLKKKNMAVQKMLPEIKKKKNTTLLLSCPANPRCCLAICKGSRQGKVQHCQLQVHNITLRTLPGTSHILSGYECSCLAWTNSYMWCMLCVCTFNAQYWWRLICMFLSL